MPRLKKANANHADVKNYWPISNFTFISKVADRLVCHQLVAFLNVNWLLPKLQSAYRNHHSQKTVAVVLKVISDALLVADRVEVILLCLLYLSAVFDMVHHDILIDQLQTAFSIHITVPSWISSFSLRIEHRQLPSLDNGRTHQISSAVCHKVAFLVWCYFSYIPLRSLPLPIDRVLAHTHMLGTYKKGWRSRIINTSICNIYWYDQLLDVGKSLKIKIQIKLSSFYLIPDSSSSKSNANTSPLLV